ncbi:hypothetical protein [Paenibacillus aceti]|uniref:Methyl-accepting chemotaxis protein n=1 Tax=Paenibacillus aceti TaxID=1820010 RepID=A0ABQ1VZR7_9BACL|nr:hypothetical protein [Paenibacillus aceti]GGG05924.1 hypothetical protein GCM10010913_29700 [Paenibacillus aceti]
MKKQLKDINNKKVNRGLMKNLTINMKLIVSFGIVLLLMLSTVGVSIGADQVSSGAQALAVGSTEQASAVEELNASISRVAEQAVENSASVRMATQYVEQTKADINVCARSISPRHVIIPRSKTLKT